MELLVVIIDRSGLKDTICVVLAFVGLIGGTAEIGL